MTNRPPDDDLRALFRELREEDERRAPGFQKLWGTLQATASEAGLEPDAGKRPGGSIRRRLAWGGSLLAAAAAGAALLLLPGQGASDAEFVMAVTSFSTNPAGGAWRSPTDGLLTLPGSEVLNTRPKLGDRRWPTATGALPRSNQS